MSNVPTRVDESPPAPVPPRLGVQRDAVAILGVTGARVRQMDDVLTPIRSPSGARIYDLEIVEAVALARKATAAGRP